VRPEDYKHLTGQIIPVVMLTTERVDGKGAFLKFKVRICARGDKHYLGGGMCCWFLANLEVGGNITNCCHSSDDSKLGMCCWFLANVEVGGNITNCRHSSDDSTLGKCCWFLANVEVGGNITNCCHSSDDSM
jgi:hypothetical protein